MSRTIVFVHGAWVTPRCWDGFRQAFEAEGFAVHAPTWPGLDGLSPEQIRRSPPVGFGGLTVGRIADGYQAFIETLPEAPVLIGHSFGGLIVQMLLDRGVGAAGVAIDPAPIGGVVPGPSALAAITPILLRINAWNRPYSLTRERFRRLFAGTAPREIADRAFDDYVIPAPGMIFHQAAFWLGSWVNPARRRQPLLITAGEKDRLVSPYLSRAAFRRQRRAPGATDFVEFAGRSHFLIGEPGWEEVALGALGWIERRLGTTTAPVPAPGAKAAPFPAPTKPLLPA